MHGWIILDKPRGLGSTQGVSAVKRALRDGGYGKFKVGHGGTLDPLATGVLPIAVGEATKLAGRMLDSDKIYDFTIRFGVETDTLDLEGKEVAASDLRPTMAAIEAVLPQFTGPIEQVPPAYSAIKQDGEPLYLKARRGEAVDVPAREVEVHKLELVSRTDDALTLHVECGSGTYVRSLARDLGERLGCGAHLTALRRLWVEPFRDPVMHTLESLEQIAADGGPAALDRLLLPIEAGLGALPALHLDAEQARRLRHGQRLNLPGQGPLPLCQAMDAQGRLVALVRLDVEGTAAIVRGFAAPD